MEENKDEAKILTPLRAIRAKCLDCSAGSLKEVRECVMLDCPLYPYRMGKSPNRKPRILTDEEREELRQRMARMRKKQLAGGDE
ncbi:hypothetical protein QUW42_09280 [Desulfovibrio piger]|uniref:hypothetical protein n=1 Tax=Desulfovibrio piger TaxID=901 RepID=UPI0025A39801|nr:hypothetical protein [Desulfovibrio piger]MDM8330471.1 hypothetical protein [Desulfovibrio piger]